VEKSYWPPAAAFIKAEAMCPADATLPEDEFSTRTAKA
jgi:hypothetical protein